MLNAVFEKITKSHNLILFLVVCILIYFIVQPRNLKYFFESSLGRILLLLFLITITASNSVLGIASSLILIGLYNTRVLEGFETSSDPNTNTKKEEKKPVQPVLVKPSDDKVSAVTADSKDAVIYPNDDNTSDDTETSATSTPSQVVDSQPVENEIDSTPANVSDTTVSTEGFSNMGKQNNNMNLMLNTYKQMIPKDSNSLVYYKVPSSKEASAFEGFTTTITNF
jgi:hypothetical protein